MHEYILDSPIGKLKLIANKHALVRLIFSEKEAKTKNNEQNSKIITETVHQLNEYFEGKRNAFDLPLAPDGTEFQRSVWNSLQAIPYGTTTTYSELSKKLGNPKAIRAVGKANGQNPIPIIIPCHRVIGANNDLIGYSGGIERKRWLLQHEGSLLL